MDARRLADKILPKDFCPVCEVKKIIHKAQVSQTAVGEYPNGAALTPPMGWSSWNLFASKINERLIMEIADAMVKSGLADCGYRYINIDDCWEAMSRDSSGRLQCDPIEFPNGIKALAQYVNSLGLKLGIYSSNGTLTCQNYPASLGHEAVDADTFAEWGVEYFKYDFCHNVPIPTHAPRISGMNVGVAHSGDILKLSPQDAKLYGRARLLRDTSQPHGYYIGGLCSRNGSAVFDGVEAPSDGEFVLTFFVKTGRNKPEFALIKVNGEDEYQLNCPASKHWEAQRRDQITVKLKKGVNTIEISNPIGSVMDSTAMQYKNMGLQLMRATREYSEKTGVPEKPIVYSICEWGRNMPWKWGRQAGNLWRTTPDIMAKWLSIISIYEFNVRLWKYASPGAWNDPDMLEVGNGELTYEENRAHFSLWCMLAAPLILGNDIRAFIKDDGSIDTDSKVYQILTNKDMIDIDRDALGRQCRRLAVRGLTDVLVKPLSDSQAAVCFFNKGRSAKRISFDIKEIANDGRVNLASYGSYSAYDVWDKTTQEDITQLSCTVEPHGVKVYRVSAFNA